MLIGICGSICAGKSTVAQYLVEHHRFRHLYIEGTSQLGSSTDGAGAVLHNGTANGESGSTSAQQQPQQHNKIALPLRHGHRQPQPKGCQSTTFPSADAMLDYVTTRWRERWVTTDITNEAVLEAFSRRPFFLLISVDAPVLLRWQRFQHRRQQHQEQRQIRQLLLQQRSPEKDDREIRDEDEDEGEAATITTLDSFVAHSDAQLYDPVTGQLPLMSRAAVRLVNTSPDLAHLYATLSKVDLLDPDRLRPSWDTYFMALASLAARRSNCMKRRVGCVLVRERRVLATGYNGTPRGLRNCGEGGCARCNGGAGAGLGLAACLCIHAEENALLEAGRERIREGATLYCDTCPCLTCSIKIAQVGIGEVVYAQGYSMDGETAAVLREAGVRLRQFVPPANGLVHLEKMEELLY